MSTSFFLARSPNGDNFGSSYRAQGRTFAMLPGRDAIPTTLHQALADCSQSIEAGDYNNSYQSIAKLVDLLSLVSESVIRGDLEIEDPEKFSIEILTQVRQYLESPELKTEVIDALAFELPKAVARFACVSSRCSEVAEEIVDRFVESVSPRDMNTILCEALGSPTEPFTVPGYFIPLLSSLVKVLSLIQRRHYNQVKYTVPIVLNVLKIMCSNLEDGDKDFEKLFIKATAIAHSIRGICLKLEGEDKKKLCALLGLYVLQIMSLVSVGITSDLSKVLPVVMDLSDFLQYCELSYVGLITGCDVGIISELVLGEIDDGVECFSQVKLGAALAVIWGYKVSEVAMVAKADVTAIIMELQVNWTKRWEALGMLKFLFSYTNLPWELKNQGISFLISIMDGIVTHSYNDNVDYTVYAPSMYASLQAIEMVIMFASESQLRKNAFSTFQKVLEDIPISLRSDVLRALIENSDSSSMIAILTGCVKEEMHKVKTISNSSAEAAVQSREVGESMPFWNPSVLELVEFILRPPKGGPPSLPECSDSVMSALNLYRYILITESAGNSNSTGILSKDKLQKAYHEWFLPLRTLVTGILAENQKDHDELVSDTICALNPIELVLYRCIELVEENLKCL